MSTSGKVKWGVALVLVGAIVGYLKFLVDKQVEAAARLNSA